MKKEDKKKMPKKFSDAIDLDKKKGIKIEKLKDKMGQIQGKVSPELKAIVAKALKVKTKLADYIVEAYNYATKVDHLTPHEARLYLQFAFSDYSDRWIREFLPEEAKQKQVHDRIKEVETRALNRSAEVTGKKRMFDKDTDNKAVYHREAAEALGKEILAAVVTMSDSDLMELRIINRLAEINISKYFDE